MFIFVWSDFIMLLTNLYTVLPADIADQVTPWRDLGHQQHLVYHQQDLQLAQILLNLQLQTCLLQLSQGNKVCQLSAAANLISYVIKTW